MSASKLNATENSKTKRAVHKSLNVARGCENPPFDSPALAAKLATCCEEFISKLTHALHRGLGILEDIYGKGVLTDPPELDGLSCHEALKRSKEWTDSYFESFVKGNGERRTMGVGRRERWAIAASLVSIKKIFPPSCSCLEKGFEIKHKEKVRQPVKVSESYLRFVRAETKRIFRPGWDRDYYSECSLASRSLSACKERSRRKGGAFAASESREDYLDRVCGRKDFEIDTGLKFALIQSAGKPRPLTITSESFEYLRPLHKLVYNRLTRCSWLARGEVTPEILSERGFRMKEGSTLTSGDFEGATDNLSLEVAVEILYAMFDQSRCIPPAVKRECIRSVRDLTAHYSSGSERILRGQMMGSLMSFPLLCIQNRLSFLFSVSDSRYLPCLINGDDILFQSTPEQSRQWFDGVGKLGLTVSRGKTLVHRRYCCMNSTYFELRSSLRKSRAVIYVPFVRVKQFLPSDDPSGFVETLKQVLKPLGEKNGAATSTWFDRHRRVLDKVGRSLYVLGLTKIPSVVRFLRENSWWRFRERLFRSVTERRLPPQPSPHNIVLSGFVEREVSLGKLECVKEAAAEEMISRKWRLSGSYLSIDRISDLYWESISTTGNSWQSLLRSTKSRKKRIFRGVPTCRFSFCWSFSSFGGTPYTDLMRKQGQFDYVGKSRKDKKNCQTGIVRVPLEWVECGVFGLGRRAVEFIVPRLTGTE